MRIEFDPAKRDKTLKERDLDFARCAEVFHGPQQTLKDDRLEYGEARQITFGYLDGREVVVVWTERSDARRIISMRKANDREKARFYDSLG